MRIYYIVHVGNVTEWFYAFFSILLDKSFWIKFKLSRLILNRCCTLVLLLDFWSQYYVSYFWSQYFVSQY